MIESAPEPGRYTPDRYFELAECGIIAPDDRVELLEGLVVSMPPQSPPHASTVYRVGHALRAKLPPETVIRTQMTFLAGDTSVPEPDIAVVPGQPDDYLECHPRTALLVVEVARSSLIQDRLTKAAIYARIGIPSYWIVNLRDDCIEVHRQPDRWKREYASVARMSGNEAFGIDAFPGVTFTAAELLPPPRIDDC